jgi:hypothetical protein
MNLREQERLGRELTTLESREDQAKNQIMQD